MTATTCECGKAAKIDGEPCANPDCNRGIEGPDLIVARLDHPLPLEYPSQVKYSEVKTVRYRRAMMKINGKSWFSWQPCASV